MSLSPDTSLLLFCAGVLLIYVELNRPGLILPGAAGLTLSLLALSRFLHGFSAVSAAAGLLGGALFLLSTRTRNGLPLAAFASAALLYTFLRPGPEGARPHSLLAIGCALVLGPGTSLLTTIAARARQNKGLDSKKNAATRPEPHCLDS